MSSSNDLEEQLQTCEFDKDLSQYRDALQSDFQYEQLQEADKDIRLVNLLPELAIVNYINEAGVTVDEGLIQVTIQRVQLFNDNDDAEDHEGKNSGEGSVGLAYHALSYVWGNSADRVPIVVNGYRKLVTRNLFEALHRIWIRTFKEKTPLNEVSGFGHPLWIDAICINQDDDSEKSEQVQRMGSIYRQATSVCIWLGAETEWSENAFWTMFKLDLRQGVDFNPVSPEEDGVARLSDLDSWLANEEKREELFYWFDYLMDELSENQFYGLRSIIKLAELPWWQRAWVFQEIALADTNKAIVLWGKELLSWANFVNGSHTLSMMAYLLTNDRDWPKLSEWEWSELRLLRNVSVMFDQFVSFVMTSESPTLAEIIPSVLFRSAAATLDVDQVYSLLAMVSDSISCRIVPDYSKSTSAVFQQVAFYLLDKIGGKTLTYVELCLTNRLNLPSWVPNLTASGFMSLTLPRPKEISRQLYSAGGDYSLFSYQVTDTELQIRGVLHDTIRELMENVPEDDTMYDPPQWQTAATWLRHFHSFIYENKDSVDQAALRDLWRIPIADQVSQAGGEFRVSSDISLESDYDSLRHRCDGNTITVSESSYLVNWNIAGQRRRPFITTNGLIGLGPNCARQGDHVCVVLGADTPSIVRQAENDVFRVVGEAYVLNLMDGEALSAIDSSQELIIA